MKILFGKRYIRKIAFVWTDFEGVSRLCGNALPIRFHPEKAAHAAPGHTAPFAFKD